jgi:hypothetical protein
MSQPLPIASNAGLALSGLDGRMDAAVRHAETGFPLR